MKQTVVLYSILFIFTHSLFAQNTGYNFKDSVEVSSNSIYNMASGAHRVLFGENYREEWAKKTRLPVLKLSEIRGGLTPIRLGGGNQSLSLRLKDSSGKEWVLRSVNKSVEGLAPELKGSIYEEWLEDNISAQHPYSALVVPVLAKALGVPHTDPVIGWVAPDKTLGEYEKLFSGTVCLLEEREPEGDSEDTPTMLANLEKDNNNILDSVTFFKARLLDLLIADWGRHSDQWRWVAVQKAEQREYIPVPRDRDQVFYVNEGILPKRASAVSSLSFLEGFNSTYENVNTAFINGSKLNQQFLNGFSYDGWMQLSREFVAALPDSVLQKAIYQLPQESKRIRGRELFFKLKSRRDHLVQAMDTYYRFLYRVVDIRVSDQKEWLEINDNSRGDVTITIFRSGDIGEKGTTIFHNVFKPEITKEIRLFIGKGDDIINLNTPMTEIKLRIVGGDGQKTYNIEDSKRKIHVYEDRGNDVFIDPDKHLFKHLSDDTLNVRKEFTDLYPKSGWSPAVGIRSGDGLTLGLSYKIENEGFRKKPYGNMQKFSALHSLTNKTLRFKYEAEWNRIAKKTDFLIDAFADVPNNRYFFLGLGNETPFNDSGDYKDFYRVSFNFFNVEPAFRFRAGRNLNLYFGPSFQYSKLKSKDNIDRFIKLPELTETYIGKNLTQEKAHGGLFLSLDYDSRDDRLLATNGSTFNIRLHGYEGLNRYSDDFVQIRPEFTFYQPLGKSRNIILANRTGAVATKGKTTFYQNAILGGYDNLLGHLRVRFAGDHAAYNNLELRINLPNFLHYALPGKIGLIAFYDVGRVWQKGEDSDKLHHGTGGGIYLAPFKRFLVRGVLGYSEEGIFPHVSIGHRF